MRLIAFFVGCLGVCTFCAFAQDSPSPPVASNKIRTLARGATSGISERESKVLTTEKEWEEVWRRHCARASSSPEIPKVDFDKEMVVVATMGRKNTGGYKVEIEKVEKTDEKLRITVRYSSPPAGAMVIQTLTSPFHFAAIPRSDLKPEFVAIESSAGPARKHSPSKP
jgi:hypothetical protein